MCVEAWSLAQTPPTEEKGERSGYEWTVKNGTAHVPIWGRLIFLLLHKICRLQPFLQNLHLYGCAKQVHRAPSRAQCHRRGAHRTGHGESLHRVENITNLLILSQGEI